MSLREKINALGAAKTPFIFCINYDKTDGFVYEKEKIPPNIKIGIDKKRVAKPKNKPTITNCTPIAFTQYLDKIDAIKEHIKNGDIYLANLTCESKIEFSGSLSDIFDASLAQFKLLVDGSFVVNSPEEFVKIENGVISTYPMKGTADFKDENSIKMLIDDKKELAEHTMAVDLLRNDLSMVSSLVRVDNFRYPVIIEADGKKLIQTVSKISGKLANGYEQGFGDILFSLLPAGSITGTPKRKCVEILEKTENYKRGFYCGIFGEYDGVTLRSAVAIRYIEKTSNGYIYKSGGGITADSNPKAEYEEMIKKVYLAF